MAGEGLDVLEVQTDRVRNVTLHREVWARVDEAVSRALDAPAGAPAKART